MTALATNSDRLACVLGVAILTWACGGPGGVVSTPQPVSATTTLKADRGTVVFSDNFHDVSSGWSTAKLPSGSRAGYTRDGYQIVGYGYLDHSAQVPYTVALKQLSVSVTATESSDAIAKSGFGVACTRGSGESAITYEFLALVGGTWEILLRHGSSSTDPETGLLKQGSSSASPGSSSVTVEGMCATLADGRTTRLALFINNSVVADITDPTAGSTPAGWFTDFIMRSQAARPSTVTATHFEVRDID